MRSDFNITNEGKDGGLGGEWRGSQTGATSLCVRAFFPKKIDVTIIFDASFLDNLREWICHVFKIEFGELCRVS